MQSAATENREFETTLQGANTLLIVEDDDALRNRLVKAMERRGFDVRAAKGVVEADEIIRELTPQFAIVDLRLMDGNGLSVVDTLRAASPACRTLVLTGYGNISTAAAAARIGAVDYIAKPATADEIVDVLLTPVGKTPPPPTHTIEPDEARLAHIERFYLEAGENVSQTARLLNMHRRTLQRLLKRNEIANDPAQ
ncbi:MAG: response regulator [Pseudomonadota bacterium]